MTAPVTSIAAIFAEANTRVRNLRAALGFPALSPDGDILIGQEHLAEEHDAPRIVIVPRGTKYEGAKPMQNAGATGYLPGEVPARKTAFLRWIVFDAHIWGEPDPQYLNNAPTTKVGDPLFDFDSTIELERQWFSSLAATISIPMAYPTAGEFQQDTNVNRRGRELTVTFQIGTPLTHEPYTILDYSTVAGDGKVVRNVNLTITPGNHPVGPEVIPTP